jgi:hypothetical protein
MESNRVHIGTSGWHYAHWRGPFYPASLPNSQFLPFYAQAFDTVEINNSFYRLPTVATLEHWYKTTPGHFCFAVKASRYSRRSAPPATASGVKVDLGLGRELLQFRRRRRHEEEVSVNPMYGCAHMV